jgi:hypothetical protein
MERFDATASCPELQDLQGHALSFKSLLLQKVGR